MSYFTGLEAQNREKYETFAQIWGGSVVQAPPFDVVWRSLFFRKGAVAFFAENDAFLLKILIFRGGAENRSH